MLKSGHWKIRVDTFGPVQLKSERDFIPLAQQLADFYAPVLASPDYADSPLARGLYGEPSNEHLTAP